MSRSIGTKSDDVCVACGSSYCKCVDDSIIHYRNPYLPHYESPPPPPKLSNSEEIEPSYHLPHQQPQHIAQPKRQLRADYIVVAMSLVAATKTKAQISSKLAALKSKTDGYRKTYYNLKDNQSSTQSKSQQRAHALNNLNGNLDSIRSYENALQLHELFPERCKQVKH